MTDSWTNPARTSCVTRRGIAINDFHRSRKAIDPRGSRDKTIVELKFTVTMPLVFKELARGFALEPRSGIEIGSPARGHARRPLLVGAHRVGTPDRQSSTSWRSPSPMPEFLRNALAGAAAPHPLEVAVKLALAIEASACSWPAFYRDRRRIRICRCSTTLVLLAGLIATSIQVNVRNVALGVFAGWANARRNRRARYAGHRLRHLRRGRRHGRVRAIAVAALGLVVIGASRDRDAAAGRPTVQAAQPQDRGMMASPHTIRRCIGRDIAQACGSGARKRRRRRQGFPGGPGMQGGLSVGPGGVLGCSRNRKMLLKSLSRFDGIRTPTSG